MKKYISTILLMLICSAQGALMEPFAFKEIDQKLHDFVIRKPQFFKATDGIELAYYSFVPVNPKALMVFYHGAGLYNTALYQSFAEQLMNENIGCYLFDIRGHGNSQGLRGDAPTISRVWDDVTEAINFVSNEHPGLPVYLGGHSSGAGMVLNYSNYYQHQAVKGYFFMAPYLGRNSGAIKEHTDQTASFVKNVSVWKFIVNGITGGYFCGHGPAVFFNYPLQLLEADPKIVSSYSVTMMTATSPENPKELFTNLDKPFLLLAAADDEQFFPEKIIQYKEYAPTKIASSSLAQIMSKTTHLGSMLKAAPLCVKFINS